MSLGGSHETTRFHHVAWRRGIGRVATATERATAGDADRRIFGQRNAGALRDRA